VRSVSHIRRSRDIRCSKTVQRECPERRNRCCNIWNVFYQTACYSDCCSVYVRISTIFRGFQDDKKCMIISVSKIGLKKSGSPEASANQAKPVITVVADSPKVSSVHSSLSVPQVLPQFVLINGEKPTIRVALRQTVLEPAAAVSSRLRQSRSRLYWPSLLPAFLS